MKSGFVLAICFFSIQPTFAEMRKITNQWECKEIHDSAMRQRCVDATSHMEGYLYDTVSDTTKVSVNEAPPDSLAESRAHEKSLASIATNTGAIAIILGLQLALSLVLGIVLISK